MTENFVNTLIDKYKTHFHQRPTAVISAPGRINLIGEHTDYTGGYVLPVAINLGIEIAFGTRQDQTVELVSVDFDDAYKLDLNQINWNQKNWKSYLAGIALEMQENRYELKGWQGVLGGTIPIGAGLSSSAAFEIACVLAFCQASHINLTPLTMALIAQKAETNWVGVKVGIMDQLISASGKKGCAIILDCTSLDYNHLPIPKGISLYVLDTMTRRNLSNSDYNKRHNELHKAAKLLGPQQIRDVSLDHLEKYYQQRVISEGLYRRLRHVISENHRVLKFTDAMLENDLNTMGAIISQSHQSLKDDFEVSSPELNCIVESADSHPGCLGSRMIGAGFGGCALALVESNQSGNFIDWVKHRYIEKTRCLPNIFQVFSSDGGRITKL